LLPYPFTFAIISERSLGVNVSAITRLAPKIRRTLWIATQRLYQGLGALLS
jgi:hypothetical protein